MITSKAVEIVDICGLKVVRGSHLDRALGSIVGVSLGDRLGLPCEMMTHAQIMQRTRGRGIRNYQDPNKWRNDAETFGPFGPAGSASDDLACTLALLKALSLPYGPGYHEIVSAEALVRVAVETKMAGWGGSMKFGAERVREELAQGTMASERRMLAPRQWLPRMVSAPGTGDGVMMRIAPLGLQYLIGKHVGARCGSVYDLIHSVFQEARLTHGHPIAAIGAALVALAIGTADTIELGMNGLHQFAKQALDDIRLAIPLYIYSNRAGQTANERLRAWGDGWYTALDDMRLAFDRLDALTDDEVSEHGASAIANMTGLRSLAVEAAPFTLAMAFRKGVSAEQMLIDTVNAGGDTDTFAAIVMSMVGARVGVTQLPLRLIHPPRFKRVDLDHMRIGLLVRDFLTALCHERKHNQIP